MLIYTTFIFFTCLLIQSGYAYDSLVQNYSHRQEAYKRHEPYDRYTNEINDVLSKENLINPNLHDMGKNKKVLQAVMASVLIHRNNYKLSRQLPTPPNNPTFKDHFEILRLTEKVSSDLINGGYDFEDFRLLKKYSGIEKSSFFDWFDEVCTEHGVVSPITQIQEKEARQQTLAAELEVLKEGLARIQHLEQQIDRNTLASNPHAYDGSIAGWANQLWTAFTTLNPPDIPTAEKVEEKIIAAAKINGNDALITDRYNHLRGAGFGEAQNLLQRIVGWNIKSKYDYEVLIFALIPAEGSTNSAMYNAFLFPAIGAVQGLYEGKILSIEQELARRF